MIQWGPATDQLRVRFVENPPWFAGKGKRRPRQVVGCSPIGWQEKMLFQVPFRLRKRSSPGRLGFTSA